MDKPTGPPCGNNPNYRMSDGDQQAVDEFRAFLTDRAAARNPGPYVVLGGPISVLPDAFCEHGDLAIGARTTGHHLTGDQHDEQLDLVLPRCYLARLLGAVLAIVDHDSSPEAHQRFHDTVTRTQEAVRTKIERLAAQRDETGE